MTDAPGPSLPQAGDGRGAPAYPGWSAEQPPPASAWDAPGSATPASGAPGSGAPGHGAPGHGQPGHGQPSHAAPGFAAPGGSWGGQGPVASGAPSYAPPGHAWHKGAPPPPGYGPAHAKPGVIPLRPLGVGEVLDGAISSIRSHPRVMLGLSAVVVAFTTVVQTLLVWLLAGRDAGDILAPGRTTPPTRDEAIGFAVGMASSAGIAVVLTLLAQIVLTGILTVVVSRAVLGQRTTVRQALDQARPRLPALLGVTLVVLVLAITVVSLAFVPGIIALVAGGEVAGVALLVLGLFAALAAALYVTVSLWLAGPIAVLERQPVGRSLSRSRALVARNFWRVLGIYLLAQLIAGFVSAILSVPFGIAAAVLGMVNNAGNTLALGPLAVQGVGTILGSTVVYPFVAAVTVLVYVDQRMRREALDIELTRAAGSGPASGAPSGGAPGGSSYGTGSYGASSDSTTPYSGTPYGGRSYGGSSYGGGSSAGGPPPPAR